jgi:hypothetical protein
VYRARDVAFAIPKVATEWQRLEHRQAALAFRDPEAQATILVNGRCGLGSDDVPLAALTQHLFLDFTRRTVESQETVPFDGREAMHTSLSAELDGVPMRYDAWVMKKDGCVYDLLFFASPDSFDRGYPRFEALVRGFTTTVPHD